MRRFIRFAACVCALALPAPGLAQTRPVSLAVTRAEATSLRAADLQIDRLIRSGDLRLRETTRDALVPERTHERLEQFVRGVPIVGGDLTRQAAPDGTVSIFGMLHEEVAIDTTPALTADAARQAIAAAVAGEFSGSGPELVVLPLSDAYHLAYAAAWLSASRSAMSPAETTARWTHRCRIRSCSAGRAPYRGARPA